MSASLVGSEMCIRDRLVEASARRASLGSRAFGESPPAVDIWGRAPSATALPSRPTTTVRTSF
eukprot:13098195-Alexandrium_andersonii.AAC.1